MAKIPTILEAGRADGKLIKTNSVYDDNQEKFLSDKIKEIDDNHNILKDDVNTLTEVVNNNELDIETKLETEKTRATNAENNLRETINNITDINEHSSTAELITVNTLPNSTVSNVQQALNDLYKNIIYDVSQRNGGIVFESLSSLLSSSNLNTLIPTSVRHGGMSIRFIQGSVSNSDNKYVQYTFMLFSFTAKQFSTPSNWYGTDGKPVFNDEGLIKGKMIYPIYPSIFQGKEITICGDSISTYIGYCGGNPAYYPKLTVNNVKLTWWWRLITKCDGVLKENISYSGARVTNTVSTPSLVSIVSNAQQTDVMILTGGVNDSESNVITGTLDCTKNTDDLDDTVFSDAYLHYVRNAMNVSNYVILVITSKIFKVYKDIIQEIANYYNLICVDLTDKYIEVENKVHPTNVGMYAMSEYIFAGFTAFPKGAFDLIGNNIEKINIDLSNGKKITGTDLFLFSRGWLSADGTNLGGSAYNYLVKLEGLKKVSIKTRLSGAVSNNRVPCWLLNSDKQFDSVPSCDYSSDTYQILNLEIASLPSTAKYILVSGASESYVEVYISQVDGIKTLLNDIAYYIPEEESIQNNQVILNNGTSGSSSLNCVSRYIVPKGIKRIEVSAKIASAASNNVALFSCYNNNGVLVSMGPTTVPPASGIVLSDYTTNTDDIAYIAVTHAKTSSNLSVKFYYVGNVPIYNKETPRLPQVDGFVYNETAVEVVQRIMNSKQMSEDMSKPFCSFTNMADFTLLDDNNYYYIIGVVGRADIYGATTTSSHGYINLRRISKTSPSTVNDYVISNDSMTYTTSDGSFTTPLGASMANAVMVDTNIHILYSTFINDIGYTYMHCVFDTTLATIGNYNICKIDNSYLTSQLLFSLGYYIKGLGIGVPSTTLNMNASFKDAYVESGGVKTYYLGLCCHTDMPNPLILSTTDFNNYTIFKEIAVDGMDACYECSTAILGGILYTATRQSSDYIVISCINVSTGDVVGNYVVPGETSRPALFVYNNGVYMIYNYASGKVAGDSARKRIGIMNLSSWYGVNTQDYMYYDSPFSNIMYPAVISKQSSITIALQTSLSSGHIICENVAVGMYNIHSAYEKMVEIV